MSLPPGTRIPMTSLGLAAKVLAEPIAWQRNAIAMWWWGLAEGLTLGAIAGGMAALCALSLAWAHMGG